MINITSDNINARTKTTETDSEGTFLDVDCIVDEKTLNKFTSTGTPDLTNKTYRTAWTINKYSRDGTCYNIIIDLYNRYQLDKIYLLSKDKGACSIYYMKDYGYQWILAKELPGVFFDTWYTVDLLFNEARFIKISFDL